VQEREYLLANQVMATRKYHFLFPVFFRLLFVSNSLKKVQHFILFYRFKEKFWCMLFLIGDFVTIVSVG
jgi:hypothetical protein